MTPTNDDPREPRMHETTIRRRLTALTADGIVVLAVEVVYDVALPLALTFYFRSRSDGWVGWEIGRDLVRAGLACTVGMVGEGDVRVGPSPRCSCGCTVLMELESPTGAASFRFGRDDLSAVVAASDVMVPPGDEQILMDDAVDDLVVRLLAA